MIIYISSKNNIFRLVIFNRFRKLEYGFDKKDFKTVTDIMSRIKVRDKIINGHISKKHFLQKKYPGITE